MDSIFMLSAFQQLLEILPLAGVDDIRFFQPAAAGLVDTVAHKVKIGNAVGIGGNGDFDAHFLGHFAVAIGQIQTGGVGIELHKAVTIPGAFQYFLDVHLVRLAFMPS